MTTHEIKLWLKAALIRAIKTVAQSAVATISVSATVDTISWTEVISTAIIAGLMSLLTSVAGLPEVKKER